MSFVSFYDFKKRSEDAVFVPVGESLTEQCHKDGCDVMNILSKYALTGDWPSKSPREPSYMDCVGAPDYCEALSIIESATGAFNSFPADFRLKMGNDPKNFLSWIHDPANKEEAQNLGLLKPDAPSPEKDSVPSGVSA
jgi:phage internal scaffolding protein